MFTLQKFDLKMSGIPLIRGEIPKEPTLKFAKSLCILQGCHAQPQPSFVLMLRIVITYTLSVVDYVPSAIPVQAEWVQAQQIQMKRTAFKALCIPVRTPSKMLWASLDDIRFAIPHVLSRLWKASSFLATAKARTLGRLQERSCCTSSQAPPTPSKLVQCPTMDGSA